MTRFEVLAALNGTAKVTVGDADLSGLVGAVAFRCVPGEAPRLTIELVGSEAQLEAAGEVTIVRRQDDFVAFLSGLDADELENAALALLDGFDDSTMTQKILDVLKDWGRAL